MKEKPFSTVEESNFHVCGWVDVCVCIRLLFSLSIFMIKLKITIDKNYKEKSLSLGWKRGGVLCEGLRGRVAEIPVGCRRFRGLSRRRITPHCLAWGGYYVLALYCAELRIPKAW